MKSGWLLNHETINGRIPDDTIRKLYSAKGCYYIQLSGGYGVYHLGEDVCGFGVPVFEPLQQLRIRIKVHTRCSARGYCNLSVTASCQPKNIRHYPQSQYTLDGGGKLPLIFDSSEVSSKNDNL